jgi:hypothetical protein
MMRPKKNPIVNKQMTPSKDENTLNGEKYIKDLIDRTLKEISSYNKKRSKKNEN